MIIKNELEKVTTDFSVKIIRLYLYLLSQIKQHDISKQLLRSGTNIGVYIREFRIIQNPHIQHKKLTLALLEAEKTLYWLELLYETKYIQKELLQEFTSIMEEITSLIGRNITEITSAAH